jgi:hypothetical protein
VCDEQGGRAKRSASQATSRRLVVAGDLHSESRRNATLNPYRYRNAASHLRSSIVILEVTNSDGIGNKILAKRADLNKRK